MKFTGCLADWLSRQEQARLAQVTRELQTLQSTVSQLQEKVNTCKSRELDHERQKKALKLAMQRASDNLDRLEGELSEATPDASAIEVAREMLKTAEDEKQVVEGILEDIKVRKFELNEQNRVNKREMDEAQKVVEDLKFNLAKAESTVRKFQSKREDELREMNSCIQKVERAEAVRKEWEDSVEELRKELEEVIEGARAVCADRVPVPAGKSSENLSQMLAKLETTRKESEKELGGSQDQLLRAANEAKRQHKDAMQEFDNIKDLRNVSRIRRVDGPS